MRDDLTLSYCGDVWRVLNIGTVRDDAVYLHLASTSRSRQQKNGSNPTQIGDFVPLAELPAELLAVIEQREKGA